MLEQWIIDEVISLPHVDQLPSEEGQRNTNYCPYHRKKGHNLEQCVVFRKIFDRKLEAGEILFQNEGSLNVHEQPFPNHCNSKGKAHAMMASVMEKDGEMATRPAVEPDLNQINQRVQNCFKLKNLYDQMDFSP